MPQDWRVMRSFGRNAWLMLGIFALSGFAYFGIQAVLLNLYFLRLGYDAEFIGTLIGFGQFVWAVMALPAGGIGRRWGTRPALFAWQALHAIGLTLLLFAESLPSHLRTGCIVIGWTVFWIGGAFGGVNATPFLMRVTTPGVRNHVFSAQVAMFSMMGFIGSSVAGVLPGIMATLAGASLADAAPYRMALWLAPAAHVLCVLILSKTTDPQTDGVAAVAVAASRPMRVLVFWGLLMFLLTSSEGSVRAFFNVYLDKQLSMPAAQIGTVFGIGQFVSIIAALSAPAFLRRFGASRVIVCVTMGISLALVALGTLSDGLAATLGYVSVLFLAAISTAARAIMSQEIVHARWRTIIAAVQTIGLGLGWASAAAIGGRVVTLFGFGPYFLISAGIAFLAALLMLGFERKSPAALLNRMAG